MEEVTKLLGPWPVLQFMFGLAILGSGVYMILRGLSAKADPRDMLEDKRQEWEAYEHLRSIEESASKIAENQKLMLDRINHITEAIKQMSVAINSLSATLWNRDVTR